jgi:hypothetical protein
VGARAPDLYGIHCVSVSISKGFSVPMDRGGLKCFKPTDVNEVADSEDCCSRTQ